MAPPNWLSRYFLLEFVIDNKKKPSSKDFCDFMTNFILEQFGLQKKSLPKIELSAIEKESQKLKKKFVSIFSSHRNKYSFIKKHYKVRFFKLTFEF